MNKTCARCQKVVYPIEELKCLDKTWHKTCFKCTECGMALNMKTYKGFNKMPYCEAHIPKAKATAIADTPELKRIAENTKIQSNVKYHADFEKAKGKFTQVADDPETLRIKQNTKIISNVAYHGDLEKKAAMEKQRGAAEVSDTRGASGTGAIGATAAPASPNQQQQQQPSMNNYTQLRSTILQNSHHPTGGSTSGVHANPENTLLKASGSGYAAVGGGYDQFDNFGRTVNATPTPAALSYSAANSSSTSNTNTNNSNASNNNNNNGTYPTQPGKVGSNTSMSQPAQQLFTSNNYNQHPSSTSLVNAHNSNGGAVAVAGAGVGVGVGVGVASAPVTSANIVGTNNSNMALNNVNNSSGNSSVHHYPSTQVNSGANNTNNIGKIADYDPLTDGPRQMPTTGRSSTTLIYSSDTRSGGGAIVGNSVYPKRIGSVTDIDPANGIYGSLAETNSQHIQQQKQQQYYQQVQMMQQQEQQLRQQHQSYESIQDKHTRQNLRIYRAIYDYEAQDVDEVSFREGDVIFEVESIDSGWMTGRVERTGKTGMLPANYVEQAVI